ncbi:hypothetical protein EBZ39_04015 [bacterium]|nr:hypothetical protein [bacterium]
MISGSQAAFTVFKYIETLEEFFGDNIVFKSLLERYNKHIHHPNIKYALPTNTWEYIESKLYLAEVSALCGVDDVLFYLGLFNDVKECIRRNVITSGMILNRMRCGGDIGALRTLCNDIVQKLSEAL